ncbi:MAG: diguanylate cyclase, partial [Pseudobutyrivibrio sp.]|nr:diguanylate cyclase [Pseudobutyrivibrio sp.]
DDEKIYDYASDMIDDNVMIGSGYHYVVLPDGSQGKELHLHLVMNEPDAITGIMNPKVANSYEILHIFARSQLINAIIGNFLLGLGVVLLIVGGFASIIKSIYTQVMFIGMFAGLMGGWSLLTNKLSMVFGMDRVAATSLEYMTLYFAPAVFGVIMWLMRQDDKTWRTFVVKMATIVMTVFACTATFLHYTNIIRFPRLLQLFHVIGLVVILSLAVARFLSVKDRSRSESFTGISVIMLIALLGIDIVRFNVHKYFMPASEVMNVSIVPMATLCFVVMLLISYLIYIYDQVAITAEKEMLAAIAYNDGLTGLFNRAKFIKDAQQYDASGMEFAVINMDLNGLKAVNDNFGHEEGDVLIKCFANIIKDVFGTIGQCFRMGGDEFVVVVDGKYFNSIDSAVRRMIDAEKKESENHKYEIDASYGIAYKKDAKSGLMEHVYSEADKRMYDMKIKAHNSRTFQNMNIVPQWKL